MANLRSLIKLRKFNVEEKQKVLAELYRQSETIAQSKATLQDRLKTERDVLDKSGSLEMFAYFGRFSQNINRMLDRLELERQKLETRINVAQDDVREAFANMKRIEIVQREREKADRKKTDDKETREMDEIGLDGFRRQEEEDV